MEFFHSIEVWENVLTRQKNDVNFITFQTLSLYLRYQIKTSKLHYQGLVNEKGWRLLAEKGQHGIDAVIVNYTGLWSRI